MARSRRWANELFSNNRHQQPIASVIEGTMQAGQQQATNSVLALRWRYRLSDGPAASVIF